MKLLMPVSVFLLMVSVGMALKGRVMVAQYRELGPAGWARLLLATFLIPPAVAWSLAHLFSLPGSETAGLFLVAAAPGAPLVTRKMAKKGFDAHLAAAYQVWGALLIPVMVPLVCWAGAKTYGFDLRIPAAPLFVQILKQILLPLTIGMVMMHFVPEFSTRIRRFLNVLGNLGLNLGIVGALYVMRDQLARITPLVLVAALLLCLSAIYAVRLLLRTTLEARHTLGLINANRHVGLAMLVAGQHFQAFNVVPAVAAYALVAALVMASYTKFLYNPEKAVTAAA